MDRRLVHAVGERGWEIGVLLAAVGALCAQIFGSLVADPDLWGHVKFGQLILDEGIPELDPYSFTTGNHPWINHELLAEIAFGWSYSQFGPIGLQVLRYLLIGSVLTLVWRELARGPLGTAGGAVGTVIVVFGMGRGLATIRPHLFTFLFFLLVLLILLRSHREHSISLWYIPPIIAVWVNTHGGVLAGVGLVGLWWLGEQVANALSIDDDAAPPVSSMLLLIASVAVLIANPYGWHLPVFLLDTATEARPLIMEWQPATELPTALAYWAFLSLAGLSLLFASRPPIRVSHALILAVLWLLPLTAVRHLPLFAMGSAIILGPHMPDTLERIRQKRRRQSAKGTLPIGAEIGIIILGLSVFGGGVATAAHRGSAPSCIPQPPDQPLPTRAVALLERSGVEANLATPFNWGEYVIWHLGPGVKVGMDGRRETVYPDSVYAAFKSFRSGTGKWEKWLDKYGADAVLVSTQTPPDNLLTLHTHWREIYRDEVSTLYSRAGWVGTRVLIETPQPGPQFQEGRCFPAAGQYSNGRGQRPPN